MRIFKSYLFGGDQQKNIKVPKPVRHTGSRRSNMVETIFFQQFFGDGYGDDDQG